MTGCEPRELLDLDLFLYDTQAANLSGLEEEFISGARLDNLVGTYTSIMGLVQSLEDEQTFNVDQNIRLVACFDNEEVRSFYHLFLCCLNSRLEVFLRRLEV